MSRRVLSLRSAALMRFRVILTFFRITPRSFLWSAAISFPATGSHTLLKRGHNRSACIANVRLRHAAMAPSCQRVSVCYPMSYSMSCIRRVSENGSANRSDKPVRGRRCFPFRNVGLINNLTPAIPAGSFYCEHHLKTVIRVVQVLVESLRREQESTLPPVRFLHHKQTPDLKRPMK